MKNIVAKLDAGDKKDDKVETIWESEIYARKLKVIFYQVFITCYCGKITLTKKYYRAYVNDTLPPEADQHFL